MNELLKLKNDILGKVYVKQKDVYFKYSTDEQWAGSTGLTVKKIYCKVVYEVDLRKINT